MKQFIFKSFDINYSESIATFNYEYDDGQRFTETVTFAKLEGQCDTNVIKGALFLAFVLIGASYLKAFPSAKIVMQYEIDDWQAKFFNSVFQEGLGQFAFENNLNRDDLPHFVANVVDSDKPLPYNGSGILALQSGGKDSLLTASLLQKAGKEFTSWYVSSSDFYPEIIDKIGGDLAISKRTIDRESLKKAAEMGGKNGHVPITYILQSLALVQAIILGKDTILTSIAHEGEETHSLIGDLEINHQWSKTWAAEQAFVEYVKRYISPDLKIGSPLRSYSELRVAELFVKYNWTKYGHDFSSCNVANYKQGDNNSKLSWCGDCPKCANSYLLFAPFVPSDDLKSLFGGQDLFAKLSLEKIFKGLLGIDNEPKPFECIGEIEELRLAYHVSQTLGGFKPLPFEVPESTFDYMKQYPAQDWAVRILQ